MKSPPIIVTGLGRSGTSITGQVFGAHPRCDLRHEKSGPHLASLGVPDRGPLTPEEIEKAREPLRRWYATEGQRVIVDKDPRWTYRIDVLREIMPEARVLYMIRDGRDVACSVVSALKKKRKAWAEWLDEPVKREFADVLRELPPRAAVVYLWQAVLRKDLADSAGWANFRAVRYERFITDGGARARKLRDWLGLPMDRPAFDAFLAKLSDDVSVHVSPLSAGNFVADHTHRNGRWKNEFTEEERAALPEASCGLLEALGY